MPTLQLDIKAQTKELDDLKKSIEALQRAVASLDTTVVGSGKHTKALQDTTKASNEAASSTDKVVKAAQTLDTIMGKADATLERTAKQLQELSKIAQANGRELEATGRGYKAYLTELEASEAKSTESMRRTLKERMNILRAASREGGEEAKVALLNAQAELKLLENKILGFKNIAAVRGSTASLYKAGILDAAKAAEAGVTAYYDTLEREALRRQKEVQEKLSRARMEQQALSGRATEQASFLGDWREAQAYNKELAEAQRLMDKINASLKEQEQRYQRLSTRRKIVYDYQNGGGTVAGLSEKYGEAETIRALAPYVKELEPQLLKLKSNTRSAAQAQTELRDALWDVHSAARGVTGSLGLLWLTYGSLLPLAGGYALATALKTAMSAGTEFNYQMKFVQVLGEEADSTMKGLSDTLLRMGGQGMFKPTELAEGMRILAQAGFQANDALKALPTTTKLAVIGETDVATAAEMAAGTMYAFGLGMRDLGHIGDVVAKAAAMSQTNVTKMGESFKYAGSTAKQYNVTLEEMAGVLTVLANSNITGSSAGTAAKNMIKDLYGTTGKSRKFMDAIGLSPYDEQGNRKSFLQTLDEIGKRLEQMGDKARDIAINEIFDERAAKGYIKLFDSGELLKIIQAMKEASYNAGFLNRSYQTLAETTKGELKQALGALQGSLIEVFQGSEGSLQSLLKSFKSAVQSNEFKSFLKDTMNLLSGSIKFLIEYGSQAATLLKVLLAYKAATTVGNVVGGLATNFSRATKMATSLTGAVRYGTIALRAFGLTALAAGGPIAWVLAGIAGLATAFVAFSYSSKEHTSSVVRDLQGLSSTMTVVSESQQKQLLKEVETWDLRRAKLEEAKAGTAAMAELERQRSAALSESFAGQVRLYDEEKSRINEAYRVAEEAYRRKKISVAEFSDIKAKLEKRDLINESEYLSLSIQQYQKHLRAMAKAREKESESRKGFWSDFYTVGSYYLDKLIEKVNKFSEAMSLAYKLRNGLWFKSVESTGVSLPKVPSLGERAQKIRDQEKLDETRLGGRQLLAKGRELRNGQGGFGADVEGSTQWIAQANEVAEALYKTGSKVDLAMGRSLSILSGEAHNQVAKAKSGNFGTADKPANLGGTERLNLPKQDKIGGKDFSASGLLAAENKRYQDEVARVRGAAQNTRAELEAQYRNRLIDETAYITQADDLRRKAQLDERTKLVEHLEKLEAIAKGTKDKGLKARAAADAAYARGDLARFDEKAASENTQAVYDAFGRTGRPIAEGLASGAQKLTDMQQEIDLLREGTTVRKDASLSARELAAAKHEETLQDMATAALTPELKKTLDLERERLKQYRKQTAALRERGETQRQTAFDMSLQQAKEDRAFERSIRHYGAAERAVARYRRGLEKKARADGIKDTSGIEQDVLDYSKDQSSEQGIEGVMNGARDAWTEFQDRAANTAAFTKQAFTSAFNGAGDSLANFLSRGKWTWKAFGEAFQDFAKQMLAQLLKIIIMRAIAGLAGGGGGSVGGGFTGTSSTMSMNTIGTTGTMVAHTGGIIGGDALGGRTVSSAHFAGATRYHTGGIAADEYPAILQRGEGVFTKGQMAAMGLLASKGGGAQSVVINVTVNSDTGKTKVQGGQEDGKALGRLIGNKVREVIVEEKRNGGLLA